MKSKPEKKEKKKKSSATNLAHPYFKDHVCNLSQNKQTKYELEEKRAAMWKVILYFIGVRSGDIRARYIFRSYAALSAEIYRQYTDFPCSIHPYSRLRLAVEIINIINIQFCYVITTYYFMETSRNMSLEAIIHGCESIYFINIIVNFFTGYIQGHSSRVVVLDFKRIAWKYVRTWLLVDLTFCAGLVFATSSEKAFIILTSLKVLKIITLFNYVSNVMEVISASVVIKTSVNIILLAANYLMWNMSFQSALEFIAAAYHRGFPGMPINYIRNARNYERTIIAFNRAAAMLQNANLSTQQVEEYFETFIIIAWRIGKIIEIHCGLKFMLMQLGLESAQARYFILTRQLQLYMDQLRYPARIKKKIIKFYTARFQCHYFSEQRMMDCVSGRLREDIIMHLQLVGEVEFLKNLPRSLLLQIGMKLKVVIFLAGDIIYKINTIGDCLYFIDKGTVAIYSESGKEICHFQDGDYFGEISLVLHTRLRTESAVAVTNCELFRLDKQDLQSTIAIYPTVYEKIKKLATQRLESTIVADEHHKAELNTKNLHPPEEM